MIRRLSLEHPLVQHCNLRCMNCDHGSPLARAGFSNLIQFQRDLSILSQVLELQTLKLVGGEPLLHPEICAFLSVAKKSGIAKRVQIWTNGLLLHRLRPGDLDDCDDLVISIYPGVSQRWDPADVRRLSKRPTFRVHIKETSHFFKVEVEHPRSREEVAKTFLTCKNAHEWSCHSFADGFYYKCSRSQSLEIDSSAGSRHSNGLEIVAGDEFFGRLNEYLARRSPLPACTTCLGTSGPLEPHRQSGAATLEKGLMR